MNSTFDIKETLELAKICKSVYSGPINHNTLKFNNTPLENQKIIHGSYNRGFCRMFWNDDVLIIAFRGTRENIDWIISNIKILPTKYMTIDENKSIHVHSGFQKTLYYTDKTTNLLSLEAIYKHINELDLLNKRKIIITGHSLGGALALLFYTKLQNRFSAHFKNHKTKIIVFGCPAVGLSKFEEYFNTLNQETIRITNKSDVVPLTPPLFYNHVGQEIWLKDDDFTYCKSWKNKIAYIFKNKLSDTFLNHKMEDYIQTLKKLSKVSS